MNPSTRRLILACTLGIACCGLHGQSELPKADAKPIASKDSSPHDYSKEAFVVEEDITRITFENDGTSTREITAKVHIQSDSGVQHWGILTFPYDSTQDVEINYVRVRKPDSTLVVTPLDELQDMPAEISRQAPFYSDLKEKHLAVKGLSVGDVLELQSHSKTTKPLAPGQFWFTTNFSQDAISLHQRLEIRVPLHRPVKWKSPLFKPSETQEGEYRVFTWARAQLEHKTTEQKKAQDAETLRQALRGQLPPPDVELSSFQTWEEVGKWYGGLQTERVKPSAEIRAKAMELTKNSADESAKIRALYSYVSIQFRYIGVDFGIGRYQPHPAADVMSNQYGDCKDKHTLFGSLLDAVGIKAYPALVNTHHRLDADVPSPAQFDHVISVVPQGNSLIWLDTTPEVAPFTYLMSTLRGKPALVVSEDKPSALVNTPEDSPLKALQFFHTKAKLSDTGILDGTIERTSQGDDFEVLFRSAFRRVPLTNWQQLGQGLSGAAGFGGDVSDVTASSPEKTDEPFRFAYNYTRKDYSNWANRRISAPLPPVALPDAAEDDQALPHTIWLGSPEELHFLSEVELPKGYSADIPKRLDLDMSFGEYHSTCSLKDGILITDRRVVLKRRELPVDEYKNYKIFAKMIADDQESEVAVHLGSKPPSNATGYQDDIWKLPVSENKEAASLYDEARDDVARNDTPSGIKALEHSVELDPKFERAWLWLGELHKFKQEPDAALTCYRKGIEADPQQPVGYVALGVTLMDRRKPEEALPVLQQLVKLTPEDSRAQTLLGSALMALKRYPEAIAGLEAAAKLNPQDAVVQRQLGFAYLTTGADDKALAAYRVVLAQDPSPVQYNDVAYALADAGKLLPTALEYAQKSVTSEEQSSIRLSLSDMQVDDLQRPVRLSSFWDTLGWVYFRQNKFDLAEKFLQASWLLMQRADVAEHLIQVYEKQHKTQAADAMRHFLIAPAATGAKSDTRVTSLNFNNPDLQNLRISKLDRFAKGTASTEMFVLFEWEPGTSEFRAVDWKPVAGEAKLKPSQQVLSSIRLKLKSPDGAPTRILRRGILGCYEYTGCSVVLFEPQQVRSLN